MNIMLVSQCSKQALVETRRVLDQFAERKGHRTWQTEITQQGLSTLRKLLRKTARRNTAVACHWIKSGGYTELLWIVGRLDKFNEDGTVPTNTTRRNVLRSERENGWYTVEVVAILAGIAGLFHDFGKANKLFQKKLNNSGKTSEPYRHEWVSLRLFEAFVSGLSDQEWLEKLANVSVDDEKTVLSQLVKDSPHQVTDKNPFIRLQSLAKIVGWLIVSHHRLPKYVKKAKYPPKAANIDNWMTEKFDSSWDSPQCLERDWDKKDWQDVWIFPQGVPIRSQTWCDKAHTLAKRALRHSGLLASDWLQDRFTSHLARMILMLADHCYSAGEVTEKWQDLNYKAYANTVRKTGKLKQRLDEHNVGVGHNAYLLARALPNIRQSLPVIVRVQGLKKRSRDSRFRWQDKAYELAVSAREKSKRQGFFGINMASTGSGKTLANARIMYGLADDKVGCRFSVALGLRTLTLQTGDALRERLRLDDSDLAVLIGSQVVRQLHESHRDESAIWTGSESEEEFFGEQQYVSYEGEFDDGQLSHWLKRSPKLHQLVSAPVLVSTIDHLTPATEGERGGKQIAPMLRLLTSDLVLDEPDDFGLSDLPALCRLVNWAGMLGSRVLLSSATLPPALVYALFDAYLAGRQQYNAVCGEGRENSVTCAWFDEENKPAQDDCADLESFKLKHEGFVTKRSAKLAKKPPLQQAEIWPVSAKSAHSDDVVDAMVSSIYEAVFRLHDDHHQVSPNTNQRVSIGLVRMANINSMAAVAKQFITHSFLDNYRLHFCVYHSQFPLLMRSAIEVELDRMLTRHDPEKLWQQPTVKRVISQHPEENHIFVVFATPVAEVGRDHDYDWAVVEPSSMRSIIQIAGRVQRHRHQARAKANMYILEKNYRALNGQSVAYYKPGFEADFFRLNSKDLHELLLPEQYQVINAVPRIKPRETLSPGDNLVDLEHAHLQASLFGSSDYKISASLWWQHNPTWCALMQQMTPFRRSAPKESFILYLEDEYSEPVFHIVTDSGETKRVDVSCFEKQEQLELGQGVSPWLALDPVDLIVAKAGGLDLDVCTVSKRFCEIELLEQQNWLYSPLLGVYGALKN